MPAVVYSNVRSTLRRICAWCHCDLGPLDHPAEQHSYGICPHCQQHYFAHLYDAGEWEQESTTEILLERSVGG